MRAAHHAVGVSAAVADQAHRQSVQADVVADLLERARVDERRDAVDPGLKPLRASPAATETMFCSATPGIDEPRPQRLAQRLEGLEAEVAR